MNTFIVKEYLKYFHLKTDEHSLHSPFFYQFYIDLIKQSTENSIWNSLEKQRKSLLQNSTEIEVLDLGAGSKIDNSSRRQVKSIAKHSLSSKKFSRFLFQLIQYFNLENVVELGTSLGINTAYMAAASKNASIHTFEADPNALKIAKEVSGEYENIEFHVGDITSTLPQFLELLNKPIDLVYADANHTYAASVAYFEMLLPRLNEKSIYIMDDIHWSAGMKRAWNEIKTRKEVSFSIDFFDAGLLFFNPDFKKQHFVLHF